jgi:hypothetical protein
MFIRFVSGEVDEDSHVSAGLFRAAYNLMNEVRLSDYEYDLLRALMKWFDDNLKSPYDYRLKPEALANRSLCWFKPTAREHLQHAWEIAAILDERDIFIELVKCYKPGYILYEDEAQVLAYPYDDLRRRL